MSVPFTFGVVTAGGAHLGAVLDSIRALRVPEHEIVVVGGRPADGVRHVPFDESERRGWITRKKNIITSEARYENIVYMHDYVSLDVGWYDGFLRHGDDFELCMTRVLNADGHRFRDWCVNPHDAHRLNALLPEPLRRFEYLLPYGVTNLSRFQYFSGAYWVAKRSVMLEHPLDESLAWGEGEDIAWSRAVTAAGRRFSINRFSVARLLKQKDPVFHEVRPHMAEHLAAVPE